MLSARGSGTPDGDFRETQEFCSGVPFRRAEDSARRADAEKRRRRLFRLTFGFVVAIIRSMRYAILFIGLSIMAFPAFSDGADTLWHPNPQVAAGLSLVIPGGGQLYNRSYLKAPISMGLEGYAIWAIADSWGDMRDAEDLGRQYADSTAEYAAARSAWGDARERRNLHLWLLTGFILASTLDAYVDAQLYPWRTEMGRQIAPAAGDVAFYPIFENGFGVEFSLTLNLP